VTSSWLGWVGVVLLCAAAMLAALLEMLLVPVYIGSTVAPVAVIFALASNVALPLLARSLLGRTLAVGLPFLAWLVVIIGVGLVPRPEGDVVLPGGDPLQFVSYGVVFGGALAGAVTVLSAGTPRRPGRRGPPGRSDQAAGAVR
jgi:hypothetical protein